MFIIIYAFAKHLRTSALIRRLLYVKTELTIALDVKLLFIYRFKRKNLTYERKQESLLLRLIF